MRCCFYCSWVFEKRQKTHVGASTHSLSVTTNKNHLKDLQRTAQEINSILFTHQSAFSENHPIEEGQDFQGSKLLPSFYDRKSYFGLLLGETSEIEAISYQKRAMEVFTSRIYTEVSNATAFGREAAEVLMELVHKTLDLMSVMFVEIINEVNMAQIFLWYYLGA